MELPSTADLSRGVACYAHGRRVALTAALILFLVLTTVLVLVFSAPLLAALTYFGLLGYAWALGRRREFVLDWFPIALLLMAYYAVSAFTNGMPAHVHITDAIAWEERLFGTPIPTIRLQGWLYRSGRIMPWDVAATAFYVSHYGAPLAFGLWLWCKSRRLYWRYTGALLVLFFAGLATYALFPEMPPWLAAQDGYLPQVPRIFLLTASHFLPMSTAIYMKADGSAVGAMPSIHVAYPVLVWLVWRRIRPGRWSSALMALYPLGVIFSVVYLGEHYLIDAIAGAGYALAAFWLVWDLAPALLRRWRPQGAEAS